MIKAQVIGNLGKDCIINNVGGKNVINFSVAHTEKFRTAQGETKDKTIWVECAYWTDKTGIAPYLKKGQQVYVEGQPDVKTYTTKDGSQGATFSLRVGQVQLLGSTQQQSNNQTSAPQASYATSNNIVDDGSDLPF